MSHQWPKDHLLHLFENMYLFLPFPLDSCNRYFNNLKRGIKDKETLTEEELNDKTVKNRRYGRRNKVHEYNIPWCFFFVFLKYIIESVESGLMWSKATLWVLFSESTPGWTLLSDNFWLRWVQWSRLGAMCFFAIFEPFWPKFPNYKKTKLNRSITYVFFFVPRRQYVDKSWLSQFLTILMKKKKRW